jgi:hypothetical protein
LLAASGLVLAAVTVRASAATDTTAPTLSTDPHGHYQVGSQLFTAYITPTEPAWDAAYVLRWKAADPSRICSQTVTEQSYDTLGGDPDPVLGTDTLTFQLSGSTRSWRYGRDWSNESRVLSRFVIRATDCAGNTATSRIVTNHFGIKEDTAPGITYQGTWKASNCSCFSGGTTHNTSTAGASLSIQVRGGHPLGLVMEKAPNRGSAAVYLDGVLKATVNTNNATTQHEVVVWEAELAGTALHTLKVVNKATAGHPRIDLDAVLL